MIVVYNLAIHSEGTIAERWDHRRMLFSTVTENTSNSRCLLTLAYLLRR
jgi:hypothetical protein